MDFSPNRAVPAAARCQAVALLVDGENIAAAQADRILSLARNLGTLTVLRVYGDARRLGAWHERPDFRLMHAHSGKNVTDMLLAIEAVELSYSGSVDGFVLASNDRDFAPLAQALRARGFPVLGLAGAKVPDAFLRACSATACLTAPDQKPAPPRQLARPDAQSEAAIAQAARTLLLRSPMDPAAFGHAMQAAGHTLPDGYARWRSFLRAKIADFAITGSGNTTLLQVTSRTQTPPAAALSALDAEILALITKAPQTPLTLGKHLKARNLVRAAPNTPWAKYLASKLPQITITGTGNDTRFTLESKR